MDALSSQANVGGYKAVLIAANAYGRYFPLLTTAAGTAKPANVLILGIGVAGLQAIATARRLGAVVKAYDVRSETREQAESLGAQFVELKSIARRDRRRRLRPRADAPRSEPPSRTSSTATSAAWTWSSPRPRCPAAGRRVLVTADAVTRDEVGLGHRRHGGVARWAATSSCRKAGETIVTDNGVTIIAPTNLPATMPAGACAFYARNISALLLRMVKDGAPQPRLRRRDHRSRRSSPTTARSSSEAVKKLLEPAAPAAGGSRVSPELLNALAIFVLAILVGFEVISKVPATLHTPLMSGANSIHGIVLVGAMIIAAEANNPLSYLLAFVAMVFGAMNVVGGYVVTDRMLQMFRKKPTAAKAGTEGAQTPPAPSRGARRCRSSGSTRSSSSPGWPGPPASCSGLHQMNSPATARDGNQPQRRRHDRRGHRHARLPGHAVTRWPERDRAWAIIVVGFVIGGGVGLYTRARP